MLNKPAHRRKNIPIPELKAVCRYQTARNDNDGVAIVLERILSIMNK